jgi:hypothetical protein
VWVQRINGGGDGEQDVEQIELIELGYHGCTLVVCLFEWGWICC